MNSSFRRELSGCCLRRHVLTSSCKRCVLFLHGSLPSSSQIPVLSSLNVDGLPYAATIGEEEFHVSNLTFEGLDSGIKFTFLADGGIL